MVWMPSESLPRYSSRFSPSSSRSVTSSLPTIPTIPHMSALSGSEGVRDADARHAGRKIPGVARDEDRAVHLRCGEDHGIKQIHSLSTTDVRRQTRGARKKVTDKERTPKSRKE